MAARKSNPQPKAAAVPEGLARIDALSDAQVIQSVHRTAKAYKAGVAKVRTLTADTSVAVFALYRHGLVGKDRKYASGVALAEEYGVSSTAIYLWRRLGKCIALGLVADESSRDWQHLAFKARANMSPVAKVIDSDDASLPRILGALHANVDPEGKAKSNRPVGGTADQTEKPADKDAAIPVTVTDPLERVRLAVQVLDATIKAAGQAGALNRETWSPIETTLDKIVKREVALLAKAERAATKAAATKAAATGKVDSNPTGDPVADEANVA